MFPYTHLLPLFPCHQFINIQPGNIFSYNLPYGPVVYNFKVTRPLITSYSTNSPELNLPWAFISFSFLEGEPNLITGKCDIRLRFLS